MANHGKTGASLDAYRTKKRNWRKRNPTKGRTARKEKRLKAAEAKRKEA